ncbi:MAG: hypothetical protein L0Y35_01925 [Flammeovirgaceae bacterium]|nr:hypothetical protein [Flammeovirgaceae bacterium]
MWEEILKAIPVFLFTMLKFIFGPTLGYAAGLHIITTILTTVFGMMASVIAFTFFGEWLREKILHRFFSNKKKFTSNSRKFVTIWRKYGIVGVAFLTPLLLTPIGGTLLAVSFGTPKEKIIFYMFVSAAVWSVIFSFAIYLFGNNVLPEFMRP